MPRLEPQDQKLKIIQKSVFWEILWKMSYLFYNPSNSTVCSTSNNSIAAAHPSPFPMNLLLKCRQLASRENTPMKGAQTQQQGAPVAHPDLPPLAINQQHIYNALDRLSSLLLPKSRTNPPI